MDKKLRLQLIMDAAGNATRFLRGIKAETEVAGAAVKATRDKISELQRTTRDVRAYRTQQQSIVSNNLALTEARRKVEQLQIQYGMAEKPTQALTNRLQKAKGEVTRLTTEQQKQITTLKEMDGRLAAAGVSTSNLTRHEARLKLETDQANGALRVQISRVTELADRQKRLDAARDRYDKTQALASTTLGAGTSAVAAGGALGAPLFKSGWAAVDFQDAMLDVKKVVDFDTPQQFAEMNRDILKLSKDLNLPAEGVAQIIAAAGQAKIPRGELVGFGEDAGQMAVAFDSSAEVAGKMMATWRTAFGMTQPQVRGLADQINYLGDNGNATALQISDVVTRIGPLGGVAGLAAGEIAALGSTIVGMGVAEEVAATGIKNTMLALTKGTAATKAQKTAYAALGLEAEAVARAMQTDAGGTILDVLERVRKLTPDRQASILTQLFGSESVAAIAPMLTQLEVLEENLNAVADAEKTAGSMAAEFANRTSGAKHAIGQADQGIKGLAIQIGTNFLPQIKAGADFVSRMTDRVSKFAEAHPNVIRVVATLLGVISAALIVFGGLAMIVAAVLGPFALLQLVLTQAGILFGPVIAGLIGTGSAAGGAAVGMSALLWPVLLVVAAVAALAAGAYLIIRNWSTIGPWFGRLWNGIHDVVSGAFSLIAGYVMNFTPLGFFIRNWGPIANFMSATWDFLKQLVGLGIDGLKYYLLTFTPLGFFVRNWGPITGFVSNVWKGLGMAVDAGVGQIKTAISNFKPLNDFKAAFAEVWTWMQELPGKLLNAGADAMRGFTQGIRGQRARVQAAAAEAAGQAETGARRRLDTHSPSRVFAAIGGDVMDGFSLGIARGASGPLGRMRDVAAALAAAGTLTAGGAAIAGDRPGITFDDGPRIGAPPPSAPGPRSGPPAMSIGEVNMTIVQQPGESSDDLVRKVIDALHSAGRGGYDDDPREDGF
nr:phage tail tape measure protein [Brevundimonas diminuta]